MDELSKSFCAEFKSSFKDICADREETLRCWREPRDWTKRMLNRENGVLSLAAAKWAEKHIRERSAPYWELRKIDLMIARLHSEDDRLWDFAPILLIEHENAHDVEVEAWNLASRHAKLKVLVFYYDGDNDLADKKARVSRVMRAFDDGPNAHSEFLLLVAPFSFGDQLKWSKTTYVNGEFLEFSDL